MIIHGPGAAIIGAMGGGGSSVRQIQIITGTTDLDPAKELVVASVSTAFTQPLPEVSVSKGRLLNIVSMETSSGRLTITGPVASVWLDSGDAVTVFCDGSSWLVVSVYRKPVSSYALFDLAGDNTSWLSVGNHCPFNKIEQRYDPDGLITLGTSTYTTSPGVHCLGRVKLKKGFTYELTGQVTSTGDTPYYGYSLFDVTSSSAIVGTNGAGFASPDPDHNVSSAESTGIVRVDTDMLIELRLTGGSIVKWYRGNENLPECYLKVVCLGRIE